MNRPNRVVKDFFKHPLGMLLSLALLCHSLSVAAFAAFGDSAAGTSSAQFLTLGASARAAGLGEAFSAAVQDADAVRYNPAAMTRVEENSFSFMHASHLEGAFLDHAAYVRRLDPKNAIGLSFLHMSYGNIQQTDDTGFAVGTAHPADLALTLAYARQVKISGPLKGVSFGLGLSYLESRIASSANTLTASFGFLSRPYGPRRARLAFVVENLGGKLKFEEASDPLPLTLKLGGALHPSPDWLATAEVVAPRDAKVHGALGAERWFGSPYAGGVALRAGLNTRTWGDLGGLSGVSAGLGFSLAFASLDYAFVPFGDLGWTHRVSLSFRFGARAETPPKNVPPPEVEAAASPVLPAAVAVPPAVVAVSTAPAPQAAAPDELYQTHLKRARAAEEAKEYAKAAEEYRGALKMRSKEAQPRLDLARNLLALGEWDEAEMQLRSALQLLPKNDARRVYGTERLGAVAVKQKKIVRAKGYYLRALQFAKGRKLVNEHVVNAYLGMAYCLEAEGQRAAAVKNYEKALRLTANTETKKKVRERLKSLKSRQKAAKPTQKRSR